MNYENGTDGKTHTLYIFQHGPGRTLDMHISFDNIKFFTPDYSEIPITEVAKTGRRGWDALYSGNKNVQNHYQIFPINKS